ncbi:SDR family oxidoreductase [Aquibium sp. LZ166]|uniref:SDR family oxidoreductase n=1 Tax=Aquibium pacificus TaxID=3153579 RepID=A0ABV3SRX4_9HYPH
MPRLEGKVAIITGAAGGMGSAAAQLFTKEGAKVLLVDREEEGLVKLANLLPADQVSYFVADVTDEEATKAFVAAAPKRLGGLDIALLNAGIEGQIGRIDELPVSAFDRVMAVNVRSVWLGLASLMPAMRATGGSIVITSSGAGLRGSAGLAAYSASKHAVLGLMRSAALEGAKDRIRVNSINPAQTRTRMMAAIDAHLDAAGRTADPAAKIPLGRYAEPSEVASMMLFLASDESSFCTGSVYPVDGGSMS